MSPQDHANWLSRLHSQQSRNSEGLFRRRGYVAVEYNIQCITHNHWLVQQYSLYCDDLSKSIRLLVEREQASSDSVWIYKASFFLYHDWRLWRIPSHKVLPSHACHGKPRGLECVSSGNLDWYSRLNCFFSCISIRNWLCDDEGNVSKQVSTARHAI